MIQLPRVRTQSDGCYDKNELIGADRLRVC